MAGNFSDEAFQPYGSEVGIQFAVRNMSEVALTMQPKTSFKIDISRRNTMDGSLTLVWSGQIDSLDAKFTSGEVHSLDFNWDQKDSDGKQVPFGEYSVEIKLPMSINFTKDSEKGTLQHEDAESAMLQASRCESALSECVIKAQCGAFVRSSFNPNPINIIPVILFK